MMCKPSYQLVMLFKLNSNKVKVDNILMQHVLVTAVISNPALANCDKRDVITKNLRPGVEVASVGF